MNTETDLKALDATLIERAINDAGSDNHTVFGGSWTGGYGIQQHPPELAALVATLRGEKGGIWSYLQIGVAAGGTERFLCERLGVFDLVVMDDGKHPAHKVWRRVNKPAIESRDVRVTEFIGSSHSAEARLFLAEAEQPIFYDLIGIDGDHTPAGVRQDWELIQPYIPKGGYVWFHDTNVAISGETGAMEFWKGIANMDGFEVVLDTKGKFGIGLIRRKMD